MLASVHNEMLCNELRKGVRRTSQLLHLVSWRLKGSRAFKEREDVSQRESL